jgi:hypothetical protein
MFRTIAALVTAGTALIAASGGQAASAPQTWSCPGSKVMSVWFWPAGHGQTPIGAPTSEPHAELFTGPSAQAGLGSLVAGMPANADQFGEGVTGALCAPAKPPGMVRTSRNVASRKAMALTCRFDRAPLLLADRPATHHGRLRIVLPTGRVAVTIDMRSRGSEIGFTPSRCKPERSPEGTD